MMAPWALATLSFWIEESQNKGGWIRCIGLGLTLPLTLNQIKEKIEVIQRAILSGSETRGGVVVEVRSSIWKKNFTKKRI
jgi:hypothetical protein